MSKIRRASIKRAREYALRVTRTAIQSDKLVYVLLGDKKVKYQDGRSRIFYIGTTKTGASRVAGSAANRATDILQHRGVKSLEAHIVTCKPRQRIKMWNKLERAMLLVFRDLFGEAPKCNSHGKKIKETDEFDYFARTRIEQIIRDLG